MNQQPKNTGEYMDNQSKIKAVSMDMTLADFPKYETNPFMQQLLYMKNTRNKIVASGPVYAVHDAETGEVHENKTSRSWVIERVDNEEFTKIYDKYLQVVFGLSPKALKLFQYFVAALKFNDERVIYNKTEAMAVTGYTSRQTFAAALAELIVAEIIARSPAPNIYYINPKVFVKGNRIDMVQTWVKKNTPEDAALIAEMQQRDSARKQLSLFNEPPSQPPTDEKGAADEH